MRVLPALKRIHISVWIILLVLVAVRVALPFACKYAINWYLDKKLTAYQGRIEDFDLALYRGAYQIEGLKIWKRTKSEKNPFVEVKRTDLSLAWRALFKGHLLGDLQIEGAKVDFVDSEKKGNRQFGAGEEDWKAIAGKLIPIKIESLKVSQSEVHLLNRDFKAPVDVVLDRIELQATNIKNMDANKELLPSTVNATARFQKNAPVKAGARINLLSRIPAFEAKMELVKLDITKLNDFFLAYGPFTFTSGKFSLYSEVSTKENRIVGYVKPFFEDLDVISDKEHFSTPKRFFNEVGLALANLILRNHGEKTVATKIEFEGASKAPDIDKWGAFVTSLRNGFIEALKRSIDESISIKDVPKKK